MKNKILLISLILFICFCLVVLFKGLNNSNVYIPETTNKIIKEFKSRSLFSDDEISSEKILVNSDYYILNIWASWCGPCRKEHPKLMELSKNPSVKIIGINYRDNLKNAKNFVKKFGNPYSVIFVDTNGIISIELGAYGVPETIIVNKDKKIIKKFIGYLDDKSFKELNSILK
tara:strand:- start:174 stop:692 length:519 start_codon:yes stop_codon:yes gene_type:complete